MGISLLVLYVISASLIIVSPGPDFIYVITRGVSLGKNAGILSALGISIGLIIHTTLAAFGLSALLQTSGLAFQIVKYLGAGYLFYLGIRTLFYKKLLSIAPGKVKKSNKFSIFRQGVFTNVFNPKAIITFMAFIPQFINPAEGNASVQIFLLGGLLASIAMIWFGMVGYFAGFLGQWLSKKIIVQKFISWISGIVLVGLGIRLAMTKR